MARECTICAKKSKVVWRRVRLRAEKFNPTIKRRQYPNLQWVRLASGERVKACAKCIKTLSKRGR
ncbi:MAG: 50S ribosomal protein L28 [Candidatus Portnoybacteria bacterium CG_4_10_14_0_8_um_filter_40_50]|uniref:50S ribosomal protein L28 n=1 Tax=Candidatus Portnoybacteria bacterium CG_4_10_14_0_8_um_filter_40_50 TaxID=1974800 RepID=A0A2M7QPK2_9BACT|nr:MAG: 50S ribosomal protein L28 [Candidatus Portnoybacteria bacterium CG_4_10_14_0_8_um_filter_40_50]